MVGTLEGGILYTTTPYAGLKVIFLGTDQRNKERAKFGYIVPGTDEVRCISINKGNCLVKGRNLELSSTPASITTTEEEKRYISGLIKKAAEK